MGPDVVLGTVAGYCFAVFGLGAFLRTARASGSPEDLRGIRRRLLLIGLLTVSAGLLFLRRPSFTDWAQFGFLFSLIANAAFLLVMSIRLKRLTSGQ